MSMKDYIGKCYANGNSYLRVTGYIDRPALLLRDPITGEQQTVVIGCRNHDEMEEISEIAALNTIEAYILQGGGS